MTDWFSVIISSLALATAIAALMVARRNANAADTSAIEAGRSADAAGRAADAAEDSAREAEKISAIEATRHHNELGPDVSVAFFWRPDRLGGVVVAEVTNRSRHDYRVKATHLFDQGGAMTLSEGQLHANATLDVFIGQLQLEDPGEPTDPWLVIRDAYRGDKGYVMELNDAFHNARHQFGRLELYYQAISEPCHCSRALPNNSEAHWATHHEISDVTY